MNTKANAEAALARLSLIRPVVVADVTRDQAPRRSYSYETPFGNLVEIEIDADPNDAQLETLARNLPLNGKTPAEALEVMKSRPLPTGAKVAIGVGTAATLAAAAYEIAQQMGLLQ